MRAGKMRHRVVIEAPAVGTSDGMGGTTSSTDDGYAPLATVWASIEGLSARERDQAQAVESVRTHRVGIRYRADVDEKCRIRESVGDGERVFRITGVSDLDGRRRYLELSCAELGNES